jgi:hypothetical protein
LLQILSFFFQFFSLRSKKRTVGFSASFRFASQPKASELFWLSFAANFSFHFSANFASFPKTKLIGLIIVHVLVDKCPCQCPGSFQCPYLPSMSMSRLHVPVRIHICILQVHCPCPCCMSMYNVTFFKCICRLSMSPCCKTILHALAPCPVHPARPCCIFLLHAQKACSLFKSMSPFYTKKLYEHVVRTCCMNWNIKTDHENEHLNENEHRHRYGQGNGQSHTGCAVFALKMYSLRSKLKQIWILFA